MENGKLDFDAAGREAARLQDEEWIRVEWEKELARIRDDIDRTCRVVQAPAVAEAPCRAEVKRLLVLRQRELDLVSGAVIPDPTWQP